MPDTALDKAFKLLTARDHGSRELALKLRRAGFPEPEVRRAIDELTRLGLLDDVRVAADYAAVLGARGYGGRRIESELRRQHLSDAIPPETRDELAAGEPERAREAAAFKLRLLTREADPRKKREKLLRFLFGRGFSAAIAVETADRMLGGDSGED